MIARSLRVIKKLRIIALRLQYNISRATIVGTSPKLLSMQITGYLEDHNGITYCDIDEQYRGTEKRVVK